jgi:hypothetical protein
VLTARDRAGTVASESPTPFPRPTTGSRCSCAEVVRNYVERLDKVGRDPGSPTR